MPHLLRYRASARQYGFLGLLGLLTSASALHAQTAPSTVYALGTVTQDYTVPLSPSLSVTYPKGSQTLAPLNPGSGAFTALPTIISGITAGQVLVGIDARPSTGVLYALGLNASTNSAQVYTLAVTAASTATTIGAATATPVGAAITLDVSDPNRSNTRGLVPNIGFDFNPRVDRIRVVAPNGANYRLNPNNGQLVIKDGNLAYSGTLAVPAPASSPYVGTAAYTNSQLGVSGTTLYDIDVTNTNAVLSTQVPPNNGQLNTVANVAFTIPGQGTFPITSPTIGLGLDTYYTGSANSAYLVEARYQDNTNPVADRFTSNLYSFDLTTGNATRLGNIAGGVPIYFADIAVAIAQPYTWLGTVSSAWGNGSNWSTGTVPTATSNVFIPGSTPNQPVVSDAQQTGSVTLGLNAVLTTADGGVLSVSGNFVNNDGAVAGSGSGRVALVGSSQQEIAGGAASNFRNLSVGAAGAFTSAATSVAAGLTLTGNLTVTGQTFTLRSNASTGTAYVVNTGGVLTGPATVQRSIDGSLNAQGIGYRHYSAPVTNTTLGDLATSTYSPVFNPAYNGSATPYTTVPYPTVYGYSQAQYESSPATTINTDFERGYFSPTASTPWVSGTAYTVNIPNSELVDFVGTLANGAISTAAQGRSAKANAGWQLLGNPYPSALDWDQVATSGLAGINNALFVFKSSGQYSGSYASYVNGVGANGGTNVVPLGQGFFVRTSAVGGSGSLNFQNSQRLATTSALFQRTTADTRPQLLLALSDGTKTTQADVYFESGATPAFDAAFDAEAFPSGNGLVRASEINDNLLSINGLPALAGTVTVPLRVAVATAGTYTLGAASLANLPAGYHAYLRDASLNTYTDLATTPGAPVSLTAGTATGRFAVVFGTNAPLAAAPAALAAQVAVYPNPAHGTAVLLLPATLRGQAASQVDVLNTLGQVVLRRTLPAGGADQLELPLSNLAAGIYTVRATTANGSVARQLRVE